MLFFLNEILVEVCVSPDVTTCTMLCCFNIFCLALTFCAFNPVCICCFYVVFMHCFNWLLEYIKFEFFCKCQELYCGFMWKYIYFYIYFQNSLNCVFMMSIRYYVLGNLSWVMLPKGIWLSYGKESDTFLFHLKFCKLLACLSYFFMNFWRGFVTYM